MNDEDDKIRRNLVLVSTAILISSWLEIPLAGLLAQLTGNAIQSPDSHKIWTVGLFVLAYMGVRYRFSAEGEAYQSQTNEEEKRLRLDKALSMAQRHADTFTRIGRESPLFHISLSDRAKEMSKTVGKFRSDDDWERPYIKLQIVSQGSDAPWRLLLGGTYVWRDIPVASSTGGAGIELKIIGWRRTLVALQAWAHAWLYSASSIKYVVPVFLGLSAVITVFMKIALLYIASATD